MAFLAIVAGRGPERMNYTGMDAGAGTFGGTLQAVPRHFTCPRPRRRLAAILYPELDEDLFEVFVHRARVDVQDRSDPAVRPAARKPQQLILSNWAEHGAFDAARAAGSRERNCCDVAAEQERSADGRGIAIERGNLGKMSQYDTPVVFGAKM